MSKTFKPHELLGVPCPNDPWESKCAVENGCHTFFHDISGTCAPLGASNARYTILKTKPVHENNWVLPMYGTKRLRSKDVRFDQGIFSSRHGAGRFVPGTCVQVSGRIRIPKIQPNKLTRGPSRCWAQMCTRCVLNTCVTTISYRILEAPSGAHAPALS